MFLCEAETAIIVVVAAAALGLGGRRSLATGSGPIVPWLISSGASWLGLSGGVSERGSLGITFFFVKGELERFSGMNQTFLSSTPKRRLRSSASSLSLASRT